MRSRRKFSKAFKRQVVEELLAGISTKAQLCRRHDLSYGVLQRWENAYGEGRLDDGPSPEHHEQSRRIAELERMVGKLTMENELLKKAVEFTVSQRSAASSKDIVTGSGVSLKLARRSK